MIGSKRGGTGRRRDAGGGGGGVGERCFSGAAAAGSFMRLMTFSESCKSEWRKKSFT